MTSRNLIRLYTVGLGLIPVIQLCIFSWWGLQVEPLQEVIGSGELGLVMPEISLPSAFCLLAWTIALSVMKSPSTMHFVLHIVIAVLMSVQFHIAGMKIGVYTGMMQNLSMNSDSSYQKGDQSGLNSPVGESGSGIKR